MHHVTQQRQGYWKPVSPHYEVFENDIEKPELDERQYKLIRLNNRLEALLIHDKDTDTSAAALDVSVGHLNDPDDMPGLAHFCEHMLFLGTKNFPKENGYSEYISSQGGHTNAYTAPDSTNYYFSVSSTPIVSPPPSGTATPNALPGTLTPITRVSPLPHALEMFASFFTCPLFTEEGTARELKAVDSEHKKNSQADNWRIHQLSKGTSRPGHPWSKFGTGDRNSLSAYGRAVVAQREQQPKKQDEKNSKSNGDANGVAVSGITNGIPNGKANGHAVPSSSLTVDPANPLPPHESENDPDGGPVGRETRQRLMVWWEKEYCAGRMKLAILGRESLDELTHLAVKLFSKIPNRGTMPEMPIIETNPLGPEQLGKMIHIKTVMDFRAIDITFPLSWQVPLYRSKPASFISHFIGHEGPGSLNSYLKDKGWITGLSAGGSTLGRGFGKFGVNVMLTKEGFANFEAIILAVYKYIALLRESKLQRYHHEEVLALRDIGFRFAEKSSADNYVSHLASSMNKPYEREHIISGNSRVWEWDEAETRKVLKDLRPVNSRVTLMAQEWEETGDHKAIWLTDKWYDTEYRVLPMSEKLLGPEAEKCDIPEFFLPSPNAFIPSKLKVQKIEGLVPTKAPSKIRNTPLSALWYKKDDQFWVPRANFSLYMITPLATLTPRHELKSRIYTSLVNDALTEHVYDASLAGLDYAFSNYDGGIYFSAGGYNEKLPVLVEKVLDMMKNKKLDSARFKVLMEDLKQLYENFYLLQPGRIAEYWLGHMLSELAWTPKDCLAEMDSLTVEEVEAHRDQLLRRMYIESLSHGNVREEEAISLLDTYEKLLGAQPVTPSEKLRERSLIIPKGSNFVYRLNVPNPKEVNSSIVYFCQVGNIVDRELTARTGMLLQMMHEPAFDELRTKQQLGYIVSTARYESRGFLGVKISIQSEREPVYLESRIDAFLEAYRAQLVATTPESFQKQKDGLISAKLEKLQNLHSEARRFWKHISNGYCDFMREEKEVEQLQNTSLEDVVNFFDVYINPNSTTRRKLSIHLRSQIAPNKPIARFSVAASAVYLTQLQSHKIPVDEEQYRSLSKAEPPVSAVKDFWTGVLASNSNIDDSQRSKLLKSIEELANTHPVDEVQQLPGEVTLREGSVIVDDIARFKASLSMGPAAIPVQEMITPLPRL